MPYNVAYRSPNHSSRAESPIRMLVLHATAGSAKSALSWLCHPTSKVSAHYVVDKAGTIYQLVDDTRAAWHAGKSAWRGLDSLAIQRCSIGIEIANANTGRDPYPDIQYAAVVALCREKIHQHQIESDMIVRHLDIAIPRGRKTDPAGFPWSQFLSDVASSAPAPIALYRVRGEATAGARVRTRPTLGAAVVCTLSAGTAVYGSIVGGDYVALEGFGSGNEWVFSPAVGGYVWANLLEKVMA